MPTPRSGSRGDIASTSSTGSGAVRTVKDHLEHGAGTCRDGRSQLAAGRGGPLVESAGEEREEGGRTEASPNDIGDSLRASNQSQLGAARVRCLVVRVGGEGDEESGSS